MLPEIGLFCIILTFCMALMQVVVYHTTIAKLPVMRPIAIGQTFFCCLSFLLLALCFVTNDFSVNFVAQNSNSTLPLHYKITAIWGAHEGSLLLWVFILAIWGLFVAIFAKTTINHSNAILYTIAIVNLGFLAILLYNSNPFLRSFVNVPLDGNDLNPLLQDLGMIIHPPILYLGYVGTTIGFAYACSALINQKVDKDWASSLRPWVQVTWMFLTLGIALGSYWAYYELGWGGWWFWDPVENASFMPWLTTTALLHTLSTAKREGQLLGLSVFLAIVSFILSLFGTFLVRSGSIVSVHAFASDPKRGLLFLGLLFILCLVVTGLFLTRLKYIRNVALNNQHLSRHSWFMFANAILLIVACGTVLLGTLFPLLSQALFNEAISVGAPYYNLVFIPIMLILFGLMLRYFAPTNFWTIILLALVVAYIFLFVQFATIDYMALFGVTLSFAIAWCAWRRGSISMRLAHLGLSIMLLGISVTPAYEVEKDVSILRGEKVLLNEYSIQLVDVQPIEGSNYVGFQGDFLIAKNSRPVATIHPEKRMYLFPQIAMSEAAIYKGILQDIYIALGQQLDKHAWAVRVYYKPYVRCIWGGALLMVFGILSGLLHLVTKSRMTTVARFCESR